MVVNRDPGEWFLGGTMPAFSGPPPFGWVQRLDPETLEARAESPPLPCGDHVWCGAILAHANGSIMSVNGNYVHRLDPEDLSVRAERRLPVDRSHNGLLALADGSLITKDLRLEGQGGTTITRLDPDGLELIGDPVVLSEGSMGRIAADLDGSTEFVYVPGTEHVWRLAVDGAELHLDDDWRPRYRVPEGGQGLAWDVCLSGGSAWLMDCGDIESVRLIHRTKPNGRFAEPLGSRLSWRRAAPWTGPQRLLRLDLADTDRVQSIAPFGITGGGIVAPPVHVPEVDMAFCWDSINGGLAGVTTTGDDLDVAWTADVRATMQPVVYPDSGELVINDYGAGGTDDLVVVDLLSGGIIDRVSTGSPIANGMFLTPGPGRSVFYCSTLTVSRVTWE